MKATFARSSLLKTLCLCVLVALLHGIVRAQNELSVPDDPTILDNVATPSLSPSPIDEFLTPQSTSAIEVAPVSGKFRRTVVVILGGVSWSEWLKLSGPSTPGFRKLLEESALAAVRLPGEMPSAEYSGPPSYLSPALLRAAGVLSSGQTPLFPLPRAAAMTLGADEEWNASAPGWEDATPAVAYARRTARKPEAEELLNLGWGAIQHRDSNANYGALGSAVRAVGARSFAFGSADTGLDASKVELLREWALTSVTREGAVDGGDLSASLLKRDVSAPFNVRTDAEALLAAMDAALADPRAALITIEWGDTRRAAIYAPLAASSSSRETRVDVAAAIRLDALTGADAWLQKLLPRLNNPNDRLLVLALPDLQTSRAQWLPCAWWRPARNGQGALLRVKNGQLAPGLVPLESLTSLLVSRLPPSPSADAETQRLRAAAIFDESGAPSSASSRVGRLLALQSGVLWLDGARHFAHAIWALSFIFALSLSLILLGRISASESTPAPDSEAFEAARELNKRKRRRLAAWARGAWVAAMTLPAAFWLVGLCLEVMRRLGTGAAADGQSFDWKAPLALGAMALVIVAVAVAARAWFQKARLSRSRLGFGWLLLTIAGVALGGFALPWNSLLGPSLLDAGGLPPLIGPLWSLWLIGATLLGVSGLTRPRRASSDNEPRRVVNLRPAAMWMLAVGVLLLWSGWNRNFGSALVAIVALSAMWLRLWLERAVPATRWVWRRGVLGAGAVFIVLLGLQRGGWVAVQSTLLSWWPEWLASWSFWWWNLALLFTVCAALCAATWLRPALRNYLSTRYSSRVMLSATALGAVAALLLLGPSGPVLLALYTLGTVFYEALDGGLFADTEYSDRRVLVKS